MFRFKALALSAFVLLSASVAHAQDPATRLNQLGSYAGLMATCELVGFETHDEADRFAQVASAEAAKSGFSETLSVTYLTNSMEQAASAAKAALKGDQRDGPNFAALIRGQMQTWTATCHQIARDPIGRILVTDSATSDEILVRTAADKLLWTTGWASWQTGYIRAAGDLAYAVGACSARLSPAQATAYLAALRKPDAFGASVGDRGERYMDFWLDQGQENAAELDFDAGQCKKVLTERATTLKATPR